MKKDIKKTIIALCISIFLFVLSLVIYNNISLLKENSTHTICFGILFILGIFIFIFSSCSIIFLVFLIIFISIEVYNKKADKHNAQIEEQLKTELPKDVEFGVSIANENNEELNKILYANIRSTALFDGDKIYLKFFFPDEVKVETNILYFIDNFNY